MFLLVQFCNGLVSINCYAACVLFPQTYQLCFSDKIEALFRMVRWINVLPTNQIVRELSNTQMGTHLYRFQLTKKRPMEACSILQMIHLSSFIDIC